MRRQEGYTLLEVIISILLTAITVSSVFSIALSSKRSSAKADNKLAASEASRQLAATLKSFVTGDYATSQLLGPNQTTNCPPTNVCTWYLTGLASPTGSGTLTDTCPGGGTACYALQNGDHIVTGLLPPYLANAPYNGKVTYTVDNSKILSSVANGAQPEVKIKIEWEEK